MCAAEGEPFRKCLEMATKAFLVLRRQSDLLITLFLLLVRCQMPQLTRREAIQWIPDQLLVSAGATPASWPRTPLTCNTLSMRWSACGRDYS